jgi:hypothetical protein
VQENRHREELRESHTSGKWQKQDLNAGSPDSVITFLVLSTAKTMDLGLQASCDSTCERKGCTMWAPNFCIPGSSPLYHLCPLVQGFPDGPTFVQTPYKHESQYVSGKTATTNVVLEFSRGNRH